MTTGRPPLPYAQGCPLSAWSLETAKWVFRPEPSQGRPATLGHRDSRPPQGHSPTQAILPTLLSHSHRATVQESTPRVKRTMGRQACSSAESLAIY